jgi:adenylosuccinate lyase
MNYFSTDDVLYQSQIGKRYKAKHMSKIWNSCNRTIIMRKLWIALARSSKELGINCITDEGIVEMELATENIDFHKIDEYEKMTKHDIMAHIMAFSDLCPNAKKFIHLGATSCYITDNADLIQIKKSITFLLQFLLVIIRSFEIFIEKYKLQPTLAYTHLQAAQLTTVGKRATLWLNDLLVDYNSLKNYSENLLFRGAKGTTGSEDSFMTLFDGTNEKCELLNQKICNEFGFKQTVLVCGQTYSRKTDVKLFNILSDISQTFYKICNDIRLLASKGELGEPFSENQVGSSAMVYKQNPIKCEKICSLSRYIINQQISMTHTYINQWCERTLDDSAIRRIIIPDSFMLLEHICDEFKTIINGLRVFVPIINKHVEEHMPFIMTEKLLMMGTKQGLDRQELHEILRQITTHISNENNQIKPLSIQMILENMIISLTEETKIKQIYQLYKSLSTNPLDYIGNIETQIDNLLQYSQNIC